jgi:DNA-binding NtrC family response regulator
MKVLVVDDDKDLTKVIQSALEDRGLKVISAKDGIDGYHAFLRFEPDLLITDIQMPMVSGLKMMGYIRAHNPMVKTIYMSGDIDTFRPLLEREKRQYSVSIIEKPFSLMSLMNLVLTM